MAHRLKTPQGRRLYALRKQTLEPVFGIIKSVMGSRQILLRGLEKVKGEWNLVTMAWNIKVVRAAASLTGAPRNPSEFGISTVTHPSSLDYAS